MKFIPILFSTPMVQAIMEGRKTMTRRVKGLERINAEPDGYLFSGWQEDPELAAYDKSGEIYPKQHRGWFAEFSKGEWLVKAPYWVGDVIWVRESFQIVAPNMVFYKADPSNISVIGWKPSIHMPKAACRIWLKVKAVRVERLQEISEEDAFCEGCDRRLGHSFNISCGESVNEVPHRQIFWTLWESINGQESWDANPWVWVVEFERCDKPEGF
jgi:hypothetical protein